jgi:hypothetical protein
LLSLDLAAASGADKAAAVVGWERLIRLATAGQMRVLASLPREPSPSAAGVVGPGQEPVDWSVEEVSAALMVSAAAAQHKLWAARRLTDWFAATLGQLAAGAVGYGHVHALLECTAVLDAAAAGQVQERVLGRAPGQTVAGFRRSLRRAVLAADPAAAAKRRQHGVRERRVQRWPLDDGLAALYLTGPAEDIDAVWDCATELAHHDRRGGGTDGLDAVRFDSIKDAVIAAFVTEHHPTHQGFPVALHVTAAASTLAGLNNQPGLLKGSGPIPASVLRALAGIHPPNTDPGPDSGGGGSGGGGGRGGGGGGAALTAPIRWDVLPVDPTGRLVPAPGQTLDHGRDRYTPHTELRRYITHRDIHCTFPGCRHPAHRCDIDHAQPWPTGHTTTTNLHTVCRRHHRAKTTGGWTVTPHPNETRTWTSPTGREYLTSPPDQLDP